MDELKSRINQSLSNLKARKDALESQKRVHKDLETTLQSKHSGEKVIVAVGDGWFVEHNIPDAKRFLAKRLQLIESDLKTINDNISSGEKALTDLAKLDLGEEVDHAREGLNDEQSGQDLPLMDIREELDEDGNVISSSVKPQKDEFKALEKLAESKAKGRGTALAAASSKPNNDSSDAKITEITEPEESSAKSKTIKPPPVTRKVTGGEELPSKQVESESPGDTMDQQLDATKNKGKEKVVGDTSSVGKPFASIDTSELLELELINSEYYEDGEELFDDEDGQIEDDESQFSFEEEFEEDSDEEEDEFGRSRGPQILKLSREELEKRFREAELALEQSKKTKEDDEKPRKKSVSFASAIEVKHFDKNKALQGAASGVETKDQKNEPEKDEEAEAKPKKVSRFKAERMISGGPRSKAGSTMEASAQRVSDVMEREPLAVSPAPVVERPVADKIVERPVAGTIIERPVADTIVERPVAGTIVERPIADTVVERPVADTIVEREPPASTPSAANPTTNSKVNRLNKLSSRSKRRTKSRGKKPEVLNIPDVDPERADPVFESIAEPIDEETKFNRDLYKRANEIFKDATVTEEEFLQAHDTGEHDDDAATAAAANDESTSDTTSSRPILESHIVETDTAEYDPEEEDLDADMAHIASDYQRLRAKLINRTGGFGKTDQEKAVEKIDEDGNPIKVSRFKAARFVNNRTE